MRVLMISKAFVLGTAQRKLEELAKYPDMELVAVTPPHWLNDDGNKQVLERTYLEGYKMIVTPMVFNGHYHTHYYPQLGRIIREVQPDLVHMDEEPYNFATFQAIRRAHKRKIPALFFAFQNLYREYPPPFRQLEQYNYSHTQYAQAGNNAAAEVLRRKGYKGQIRVIAQFGADPAIHFPNSGRPVRSPNDPFILGYVGRLKPEKGLPLIIEALASLPGYCRAVFVGHGPLREDLERQAANLGVADRVTFKAVVPSYKVPDEMRQMDVFLLPSLTRPNWAEQFGRVLVEAMCCG
ncbi:MAG: glycosyltransferase, partial [Ktedonobacteraceae bacterium]|nr:glycosyltransferase [Ktedonobacteraceae bacterium]